MIMIIVYLLLLIAFVYLIKKLWSSQALMNNSKNVGIALIVIGGAIGFWVYTRMTSLAGKLVSWSPPFTDTEFETSTFVGAGIGVLCLIIGIRKVCEKKS